MIRPQLSDFGPTKAATPLASRATSVGRQRWVVRTLLFFAATINYVDRQVIGILKPTL